MRTFAASLPWFLPGMLLTLPLVLLALRPVARRLDGGRGATFLLLMGLAAILWATLPPDDIQLGPAAGFAMCDLRRLGPAPFGEYLRFGDVSLNVLLFVPYGLAVGWLWQVRPRWPLLALGALLPFAIEAWQSLLPVLGRGCQGGDLFDNLVGLLLGSFLGLGLAHLARRSATRSGQRLQ